MNMLASRPMIVSSRFSFSTAMPQDKISIMATSAKPMTARLIAISIMVKAELERWNDGVMEWCVVGYWILDTGYWIPDTDTRPLTFGCGLLSPISRLLFPVFIGLGVVRCGRGR